MASARRSPAACIYAHEYRIRILFPVKSLGHRIGFRREQATGLGATVLLDPNFIVRDQAFATLYPQETYGNLLFAPCYGQSGFDGNRPVISFTTAAMYCARLVNMLVFPNGPVAG